MKTFFWSKFIIITIAILGFVSCKDSKPHFTIEGTISNADSAFLYLQRRSLTEIKTIDSVKLDSDGKFKFKEPAWDYPEYYLLKLNNQVINLAIDSTESITINASKQSFGTDYTVEGSESTSKIKDITLAQYKLSQTINDLKKKLAGKEISGDDYINQMQDAIAEYKNLAKASILSDYTSMAGYFALFQKVDNLLIFDPYEKKDLAMFRAVATAWDQTKSKSPRAAHVRDFTLTSLAEVKRQEKQEKLLDGIDVSETDSKAYYNVTLPDINNKNISLSSTTGKVVILDFTAYQTDFSPAHNILINNVYSKYKQNVEVYQVSFDNDAHAWRNTATNLPWICVRDAKSLNSDWVIRFNIRTLPTTFLLDKKGDLVKRLAPTDDLSREVQKLL